MSSRSPSRHRQRVTEQGRRRPRHRRDRLVPRRLVLRPDQPRRLREPRPDRDVAGLRPVEPARNPPRSAPHIWRRARHARTERRWAESADWQRRTSRARRPRDNRRRSGRNRASARRARARAGTTRRTTPPAPRSDSARDRRGHRRDARLDRLGQLGGDEGAKRRHRRLISSPRRHGEGVRGSLRKSGTASWQSHP